MGDEVLHQYAPKEGDPSNNFLHSVAEGENVTKVDIPPKALHRPLAFRVVCKHLRNVEMGDSHKGKVPTEETNKTGPDGDRGIEREPQDATKHNSTKIGRPERIHHGRSLAFKLSGKIVCPCTSKGFEESDQDHNKVDIEVDHVQEG
ncbi:unnamed protein product [Pseudo-nitzschia multistriata]|uniref:Uncharacterized protein n=1 Tax=Pseudo-nitzschia multistriata TaxID=183589 RepID=A0A448YY05_9STRA|nr:unnamed protein product [Pseudo-nitzschia multistriata]